MRQAQTQRPSFTLVELLMVVAIIGILSAIGIGYIPAARSNARNAQRFQTVTGLTVALERYYAKNGFYPHVNCGDIVSWTNDHALVAGETTLQSLLQPYMPKLDNDPLLVGNPSKPLSQAKKTSLAEAPHGNVTPFNSGGVNSPDNYHIHLFVSGSTDNWQHYLITTTLERSGAASILAKPGVIQGGVLTSRSAATGRINFNSDSVWHACTDDNTTPHWFMDNDTPKPPRPDINCGDRIDTNDPKSPDDHYYILCMGRIAQAPSSATANDGQLP